MSTFIALESIELQLYTDEETRKIAVVQVTNPSTYDRGLPKANGVNDPRMGVTDKALQCPTCGMTSTCNNHYGFIELEKPVIRLGHIASTLCILRSVCWACSRPKFSDHPQEGFVDIRALLAKTASGTKDRLRGISEACKNRFKCPWKDCGVPQPVYSRINKVFFGRNFRPKEQSLFSCDDERLFASRRLLPDEIQSIFRHIPNDALILMGYRPEVSHPQNYIFKAQLVPPPSIRPATSASSTEARMRGENDLTVAFQDLVRCNNELSAFIVADDDEKIQIGWDKLQIFSAAIINQNAKKLNTYNGTTVVHVRAMGKRKTKVIKDRLTGKKGRLRGNLSGKRVDQAGRTVVGPDASHDIYQLGVPSSIMRTLTFPENVNDRNKAELAESIVHGAGAHRGALTVRQSGGDTSDEKVLHISLLDLQGRRALAASLQTGWTVERHLRDGDWVLFNRQPSLHKASIMAFQAYETRSLQFKLPLPCTKPFNADFDGDEMNIHALQDYSAIAEAQEIMSVPHQMVTPQNNSVIIALVQDSIVGAYMMSRKDAFVNREEAMQLAICIHHSTKGAQYPDMPTGATRSFVDDLGDDGFPCPAILKGCKNGNVTPPMWTGKQILSWALPTDLSLLKPINGGDVKSLDDLWDDKLVIVRNGEILAGRLCKQTVGNSSGGIVQALWKQNGPWAAAKFVGDAQRILMNWLRHDTVCISIRDCLTPSEKKVDSITAEAMGKVDALGTADIPAAIRELKQTQLLQETLRTVGATVLETMDTASGIATVVASGSKGNLMNIAQIAGLVGQQTINGSRIAFRRGPFGPRTLANFAPGDNSPESRGFVASSYMMGLQPSEFFFHQQAGREGVVATAVSTADTGYNQRRMVKNQESEVVGYDLSVRVSSNLIVQQHYGGDDYDGTMVERVKLAALDFADDVAVQKLCGPNTPQDEIEWISAARKKLISIKSNVYGNESSKEVCMPCNFLRILTSTKVASTHSGHLASAQSVLRKLLLVIYECHGNQRSNTLSTQELIFWEDRDWRIVDDSSLQARLCVTLQCTTLNLTRENLFQSEEDYLIHTFRRLYIRGIVNPGEGVGAVGSSSIGEPSTQMTLNIFHYSGIAEKNVTLTGLPRFKQIINAVDNYDTSNMRIHFHSKSLGSSTDVHKYNVRALSSRLVRTGLSSIVSTSSVLLCENNEHQESLHIRLDTMTSKTFINLEGNGMTKQIDARISSIIGEGKKSSSVRLSSFAASFKLDKNAMVSRHLGVDDIGSAMSSLLGNDALVTWSAKWEREWIIMVRPPTWGDESFDKVVSEAVHDALLEHVAVNGIESIKKAVPSLLDGNWIVETEGSDLLEVAQLSEVDALKTTTNNIQEVARVLGVEAALCLMQSELHRVLSFDGSYVDPRHTWLLADTVARSGSINPLNRHKMEELGGSLLQCASFEQTLDVFEHGAAFGKFDTLGGATEKLIVGQPVNVGTGSFAIIENIDISKENIAGSFVPPLATHENDDFDDAEMRYVASLDKFSSKHDTTVKPLSGNSKPAYERVVPLTQKTFKPPAEIPDHALIDQEGMMVESIKPIVSLMRKQAQLCQPVWIITEVFPIDEDSLSAEEFGDIESVLESYGGWIQKPKAGQFVQCTEVEYDIGEKRIFSRVEYTLAEIKAKHRVKTVLKQIDCFVAEPMDAWTTVTRAITFQDVSADDLPTTVTPQSVRVCQEKIFEKGAWIIRLSRVWRGANIVDAEEKQRGGSKSCTFHLSVEMVRPWDLMEERGGTDIALTGGIVERVMSCLNCIKD
jgi:DNA-directed RNA polymerase II subunit RPB1